MALAGAMAFSGKAIIVKLSYRWGVDAVLVILLRMLFALPIFAAMAWWAGRGRPPLARRDWLAVIGLGICGYYLASFLDFLGLQFVSASLERLILYLNPTLVLLLAWMLDRQPVRRQQLAGMAIGYVGVLLVFGREASLSGGNVALGALLVFLSAVSYAAYLVFSGQVVKRLGALRLVGLATTVACLCCIAQYLVLRPTVNPFAVAAPVIWLALLNATLCTAVPVLLVMLAIERVGPTLTAQAGMVGPLSTIALGIWLLDEPFTGWLLAGTLLVLVGIYWFSRQPAGQGRA